MESQFKTGTSDGTQATPRGLGTNSASTLSKTMQLTGFILRIVAIILTFIAAIVMGTAKQTKSIDTVDGILTGTVKPGYSSALVYFIVVNVLVFLYSAISLAISFVNRSGSRNLELPFSLADLVVLVLLFSSSSAATAISVIAEKGNSRLGWDKICNIFDTFCGHITASIVLSMFASVAYLVLVMLAILGLHKRSQQF